MASNIEWDIKDFVNKGALLIEKVKQFNLKAVNEIADEVLRLSQREVPHDKGLLQNSGHVEPQEDEAIVGYNKVYAARLHEHPEYRFQKGRKGKYLEDPIKHNLNVFIEYYNKIMSGAF
jgi:hypothetical protein